MKINKKIITFITFGLLTIIALLWFSEKRSIPEVDTIVSPTRSLEETVVDENIPFSVYEDLKAGYKFAYPPGFQIKNLDNRIEVISLSGRGKIIIQIVDNTPQTEIIADNLTKEESEILQNAQNMIKDTFEFVKKKYSEKELYERFMNASPSGSMGN